MADLLPAILNPINLALTALLAVVLLYWLIVILGGLGMDTFDFDLDGEPDLDVEAPTDGGGGGAGLALLRVLNLGDVPLMVWLSAFAAAAWAVNMALYPLVGNWSILLQLALLLPVFIAALAIAKLTTQPLKALFRRLREEERATNSFRVVGQRVRVVTSRADHRFGRAEIATDGSPIVLNVRTDDGTLERGREAVVVSHDTQRDLYVIRGF